MKIEDYDAKIALFCEANPLLSHHELAVLLTSDLMYKDLPGDLSEFRKKYAHLDPSVLTKSNEGIAFLRIAEENRPAHVLKGMLNAYLNVKFHDIKRRKGYEANAAAFKEKSIIASRVIDEILAKAALPGEIVGVLMEREEIRSCYDFYQMLRLYKGARDERIRYEILRKIGLIVLIARINQATGTEELGNIKREVRQAFDRGLGRTKKERREYYLWLNARNKVDFTSGKELAQKGYTKDMEERRRQARDVYPLQRFVCHPFRTFSGNQILHMEIRNKFGDRAKPSYTSYVEKIVRKNLEFPSQVHDTIGVKIVVEKEDQIQGIILDLESFLGGSSTRKMEKNTYHRFGRRRISEYSSPEYFMWKAVYDITLPHPSVSQTRKMLKLTRGNHLAQKKLREHLDLLLNHPRDFVIEVQLQDIKSYLLSMARGSSTAHTWLKMNQIRSNSFYKFFPKEIYEGDIARLKLTLLGGASKR